MGKKFIISVDLGGTNLRVALLDLRYRIVLKHSFDTRRLLNKNRLIKIIIEAVNNILESQNLNKRNILGVGLGLPGSIDYEKGAVHSLTNIPGWKGVRLGSLLKKKLGIPVFMDNDANLMCLAEYRLGAAGGSRYAVCLTLGTGVGAGVISGGRLYRGANNAAGEVGHIPLNESGRRCNCGGRGCLETYVGNSRILAEARRVFGRRISLEQVSGLARRGNAKALGFWSGVGRHLGIALTGVVNLLNPDVIVIGGGVANAGKALLDEVKKVIRSRAMTVQARHVKVYKARLGSDAGLIGAAVMVRDGARG
ncbi:MAG: ROK family protein [Candidatus Omnitrophota bacterium]